MVWRKTRQAAKHPEREVGIQRRAVSWAGRNSADYTGLVAERALRVPSVVAGILLILALIIVAQPGAPAEAFGSDAVAAAAESPDEVVPPSAPLQVAPSDGVPRSVRSVPTRLRGRGTEAEIFRPPIG